MWEAEVNCSECGASHKLHAEVQAMPRGFGYQCPTEGGAVSIRFRDPSVMLQPWREVETCSPGSLPVTSTEFDGAIDI